MVFRLARREKGIIGLGNRIEGRDLLVFALGVFLPALEWSIPYQ